MWKPRLRIVQVTCSKQRGDGVIAGFGSYCPILWEFPLAALPGGSDLSSCLLLFKNMKTNQVISLCLWGRIAGRVFVLIWNFFVE